VLFKKYLWEILTARIAQLLNSCFRSDCVKDFIFSKTSNQWSVQ